MELRKKFAEKCLNENLNHLPFKESLELNNSNEKFVKGETREWYCINREMYDDNDEYILSDEEFYLQKLLEEFSDYETALNDGAIEIGNEYDHFDEFTLGICPAPTYIELNKK